MSVWCWHKYEDVKTQITKRACFGFAGCELPGYRLIRKCKKCGKTNYMRLNMVMPKQYLYDESIWKDIKVKTKLS